MWSRPRASFRDRADAGQRLAAELEALRGEDLIVLGVARGGVAVAAEVARALGAELDVLVARKVGAPRQPELALGAVTADGASFYNEELVRELELSPAELAKRTALAATQAREREALLRGARPPPRVAGRTVVLVDDGLATGATVRAALRSVRRRDPARLILSVPVGAPDTCAAIAPEVDELVCLERPRPFYAVGLHYEDFGQTSDADVRRLLARAPSPPAG